MHDPAADPGADRDADHVLDVLRGAEGELAPGRGVRVVLDHHGDLQRVRDPGAERLVRARPGSARTARSTGPTRRTRRRRSRPPPRRAPAISSAAASQIAVGGAVDRVRRGVAIRAGHRSLRPRRPRRPRSSFRRRRCRSSVPWFGVLTHVDPVHPVTGPAPPGRYATLRPPAPAGPPPRPPPATIAPTRARARPPTTAARSSPGWCSAPCDQLAHRTPPALGAGVVLVRFLLVVRAVRARRASSTGTASAACWSTANSLAASSATDPIGSLRSPALPDRGLVGEPRVALGRQALRQLLRRLERTAPTRQLGQSPVAPSRAARTAPAGDRRPAARPRPLRGPVPPATAAPAGTTRR